MKQSIGSIENTTQVLLLALLVAVGHAEVRRKRWSASCGVCSSGGGGEILVFNLKKTRPIKQEEVQSQASVLPTGTVLGDPNIIRPICTFRRFRSTYHHDIY